MYPVSFEFKKLDRAQGELKKDSTATVFGQLVESPCDSVVVDRKLLLLGQTECRGFYRFKPLAQPVKRIPRNEHVVDENADRFSVAQLPVTVAVDVLVEDASKVELIQEELDERVSSKPVDLEDLLPSECPAPCNDRTRSSLGGHLGAGFAIQSNVLQQESLAPKDMIDVSDDAHPA